MMNSSEMVSLVEELAREVNEGDPIDFAYCPIDENTVWNLMSNFVVEKYYPYENDQHSTLMYLSTITQLVVQNYVLHTQLLMKK
jgi:hypothetical protein